MSHDVSSLARVISVSELLAAVGTRDDLVILDVRFTPGQPGRKESFTAGHIPGARYIDLSTELADPDARARGKGSNPLPQPEQLQARLRELGVSQRSIVVVTDDTNGAPAARAWWVLTWAGLGDVRLLEGGLKAWVAQGGPFETGEAAAVSPGDVVIAAGSLPHVDVDDVLDLATRATLIDARPAADFSGPNDGHIPGARSFPAGNLLNSDGTLAERQVVLDRLSAAGIDPERQVLAYCGGGVAASLLTFGLSRIGTQVTLYPGSWSEWRTDPERPTEA